MTMDTTETDAQKSVWHEAIAASAEAAEPTRERFSGEIKATLTAALKSRLGELDMEDRQARKKLEERLDSEKEKVKGTKAEIEAIDVRVRERLDEANAGVMTVDGDWIREKDFRLGTVRIICAETGLVMAERALTGQERQTTLGFDGANGTSSSDEDGDEPFDDVDGDEDEPSLPDFDSTTNLRGDPDEPEIDDPETLLDSAGTKEPTAEPPPSKPTRRRRKAK